MDFRIPIFFLFFFIGFSNLYATHIVGGEIYYKCIGNNEYKIIIKLFRDCNGNALFDGAPGASTIMRVGIFKSDGTFFKEVNPVPVVSPVVPNISNPCLIIPPNSCVEQGYYEFNIVLPANPGGYDIVYSRCCRNGTISNLFIPGDQGASYFTHIPDPGDGCNDSPYYSKFPPTIICVNEDLNFSHSAIDPDGDSLVYELCDPFLGGNRNDPIPPPSPPPFNTVSWRSGYSANYPIDASPPIRIDPITGLLTGKPTQTGQYVVGVCVKEYRNGVLLNTLRRDFQFNIAPCDKTVNASVQTNSFDSILGDIIIECEDQTVNFQNNSSGSSTFYWDFGDNSTNADTSVLKDPSYTYPDTGLYIVRLIANPEATCSDTIFVKVLIYPTHKSAFTFDASCPNEPVTFIDSSYTTYGEINSWEWFFGNGLKSNLQDPEHIYNTGSSYNVTLVTTTNKGCKHSISKKVDLYPMPQLDFTFDSTCLNLPLQFTNNSIIVSGNIVEYKWNLDNGDIKTESDLIYTYTQPGIYNVALSAITDEGCKDTIVKPIEIRPITEALISNDTVICLNEKALISASGGIYYNWSPKGNIDNDTSAITTVSPQSTTTYLVIVSDKCYWDTASVTVSVNPLPTIEARQDTSIFRRDSVLLYASGSGNIYKWDPPNFITNIDSAASYASPWVNTTYTVTNIDSNGCINKSDVIIYVRDICNTFYIPNAFSPNGDGVNDEFYFKDYGDTKLILFQVFNRWGKLIYETNDLEDRWDGKYNGEDLDLGTYPYRIMVNCGERVVQYGGSITLLR